MVDTQSIIKGNVPKTPSVLPQNANCLNPEYQLFVHGMPAKRPHNANYVFCRRKKFMKNMNAIFSYMGKTAIFAQKEGKDMELRIKNILKEKGMSQTELAGKLGITSAGLTKRLKGYSRCDLGFLERVAEILDVPVVSLIDDPKFIPVSSFLADGKRFEVYQLKV